jgi:hypothetical protein
VDAVGAGSEGVPAPGKHALVVEQLGESLSR